jgi:DNA-binding GntR family transcriptional regulator
MSAARVQDEIRSAVLRGKLAPRQRLVEAEEYFGQFGDRVPAALREHLARMRAALATTSRSTGHRAARLAIEEVTGPTPARSNPPAPGRSLPADRARGRR